MTLAVALALLVPAAASSKPARAHGRPLGIVPPASQAGGFAQAAGRTPPDDQCAPWQTPIACNLDYQGGPVMHSSKIYAIYWVPSGFSVDTNYESLINRYFADVAAESSRTTNVYSAATQYYDAAGPIAYQSSFAGSYVDTNAFPTSGCDDEGGDPVCLTDQQIQDELQNVLTAKAWHASNSTMFFVMTPNGVGSCFDDTPPSLGGDCTTNTYCAYHNSFTDSSNEPVIYGNEPYDATISGCDPGSSPNNDDADASINTLSHEHNEAITDPFGDAWWNFDSGQENGDNCAWIFGNALGGNPGVDEYNQVINGHHYWLQEEWSNDGSDCVQHYLGVPVNFSAPKVSGIAAEGKVLSATPGTWSQSPTRYTYQWTRCSSTSPSSCLAFPGSSGQSYRLTAADVGKIFRVFVDASNAAGTSFTHSAATGVVIPLPASTTQPIVSGDAIVGRTLSTTSGTWNTSARIAYQWQRCSADLTGCTAIPGATAATYVLAAVDAGHVIKSVVSATNIAGTTSATSPATAVVVAVPHASRAPRISGKAKIGKRLTALRGTWTGPPETYRYTWLRCSRSGDKCRTIKKATHAKYRVTKSDSGHRLRVRVTALNVAGSKTATSRATKRVPAVRRHRHR
jgi:hypothetical protein